MKICFLAASNSIHSHKWINFFSNKGHEVIWISLVQTSNKISDNIKYYEFTNEIFFSLYKVRKLILKLNPDIVHVHYLGYYGLLGLFSGAKCIVSTPWGPLRKKVGKEGRNIIIKKYDYENEMNKVNDLYLKLI